jgi:hypothetical protein
LLGSFFKGEMPDPWPAFQPAAPARTLSLNGRAVPSRNEPSRTPSHRMLLSRMALAASVALLLLAGWFLGGSFNQSRGPVLPSLPDNGAAKRDVRFPHVVPNAPAKTPEKAKADRSSAP